MSALVKINNRQKYQQLSERHHEVVLRDVEGERAGESCEHD
jgi:hypothetical protein